MIDGPTDRTGPRRALDPILDRFDELRGRDRTVTALTGGLTNQNYRVDTQDGAYVVRLSSVDTDLLAIDREREHHNSLAAAAAGVGAPVIGYLPGEGVLVVGLIQGTTLTDAQVRDPDTLPRIAQACRALHAGPRFEGNFDMFAVQRGYLRLVRDRGIRIPAGYDDHAAELARIEAALAVRAPVTVPCNNDLLAANFIDDGRKIWIIDYEYSGNNDACFELGNLASECRLSVAEVGRLVAHYYGHDRPDKVARCLLFGLAAHYSWTLWAAIQASASSIDFDFWSWGLEKYELARSGFGAPDFEDRLEQVTRNG